MTGVNSPDSGLALIKNKNVSNDKSVFKEIGFCPQENTLFDNLTGKEHLELYGLIRGVQDIPRTVTRLIDLLELNDHKNKLSKDLSGGNKRKLMTALSLIGEKLFFF